MTDQQKTTAPTHPAPVIVTVPSAATAPKQTPRRRQPTWWTKSPVLATGALLVLVVELAAYVGLGLLWWAVANAVALVLLFTVAVTGRQRGQGGLLRRLRPRVAGSRSDGPADRGRMAGLPRLGGGRGGAASGSPGGGLRSRLPRLLGGTGGRRTAGGGAAAGGRRGLAGLLRGGGRTRPGAPTGGSTPAARSGRLGFRNPLRGRGGQGGGSSAGSAGPAGGRTRSLLGRSARAGSPSATRSSLAGGSGGRKGGPSRFNPLAWKSWRPGDVGKAPANRAKADRELRDVVDKLNGRKPSPKPSGDQPAANAQSNPKPPDQRQSADKTMAPKPVPVPKPRHAAAPTSEGNAMSDLSHSDDASLQRWGRNLSAAEAAADEVQRKFAEAEAAAAQYRTVMEKISTQYQTELPPSGRLSADLDGVLGRAKSAVTADDWRAVAADAATLPMTYRREHETDEDRVDAPRGSRAAEKRADVTAAEQDV